MPVLTIETKKPRSAWVMLINNIDPPSELNGEYIKGVRLDDRVIYNLTQDGYYMTKMAEGKTRYLQVNDETITEVSRGHIVSMMYMHQNTSAYSISSAGLTKISTDNLASYVAAHEPKNVGPADDESDDNITSDAGDLPEISDSVSTTMKIANVHLYDVKLATEWRQIDYKIKRIIPQLTRQIAYKFASHKNTRILGARGDWKFAVSAIFGGTNMNHNITVRVRIMADRIVLLTSNKLQTKCTATIYKYRLLEPNKSPDDIDARFDESGNLKTIEWVNLTIHSLLKTNQPEAIPANLQTSIRNPMTVETANSLID